MKIRKKSKQEQGITLIALVVTIIVLLILASVTISAVLGENGLVQKAKQATQAHQNAVITENNQMNNASNFINTLANNDSQDDEEDDEEDEGEWWIPTEAELAELQAADAITIFGTVVGLNVDIASMNELSNDAKVMLILYQIPNAFYVILLNNPSTYLGVLTKKSVDVNLKEYENQEKTDELLYGILKNATNVPFWIDGDTGSISYECPLDLDELTHYVSQSYYNRVMSHIRSAIANPVLFDDFYTITYNGNGGTPSKATDTGRAGSSLEMATATREGYAFDGWYTAAEGGTKVEYTTMPSKNETLYAHWRVPGSYTLTFVNELGQQQIPSITALEGSPIELPTPESNNDNAFFGRMVYKRRRRRKNFRKLYNNAFI